MSRLFSRLLLILMLLTALGIIFFGKRPGEFALPDPNGPVGNRLGAPVDHRTIVTFWEKWSRHEAAAMQRIVDQFNLSQDRIFVNMVSMSQINQKLLIATAGGDPPDVAGLFASQIGPFAATGAIEPLDELTADGTVTETTYKPFIWRICAPKGRLYAAASTPNTCAIYWNKDHFRQAGLDPEKPPVTMEELTEFADKLMIRNGDSIERIGFLPNEPGWWDYYWGIYWGNKLYDENTGYFHIDTPAQREAFKWYQSFPLKYNVKDMQTFASGFGQFNTPQNAFINGKVSIIVQGSFFCKFIELNNPAFQGHYGISYVPLPKSLNLPANSISLGDLDCWVIPKGARHKEAALEFLRYLTRQDVIEALCTEHAKPSPLMKVSPDFFKRNPNPNIEVFENATLAPHVVILPTSPVWERVQAEIVAANGNMWRDPEHNPVDKTLARLQKTADEFVRDYQHYQQKRARMNQEAADAR